MRMILIAFLGMSLSAAPALGQASPAQGAPTEMSGVPIGPKDLKWVDGPPALPKGVKIAILYGDPGKPGLFVMRIKFPANYKIPPHWHPVDENMTMLQGTIFVGHGDKFDPASTKPLSTGSFLSMPAKMHHFAYTKKEAILEFYAMGPFSINYINPEDNPSISPSK